MLEVVSNEFLNLEPITISLTGHTFAQFPDACVEFQRYTPGVMNPSKSPNLKNKQKIIAEIGLGHEGSVGLAISMAQSAVRMGADIIKFQAHFPEEESSEDEEFRVSFSKQDKTRWDYWKRTSFSLENWIQIREAVEEAGGDFAVSVFSSYAVDFFVAESVKYLKLGSGDLSNPELRDSLTTFNGTLILSTGLATWQEIVAASEWLRKSNFAADSAILQCTSMYPTPLNFVGLNIMSKIKEELGVPSGLSDHSTGISGSIAALTLGAQYIEKHFVLHKDFFGPDVPSSITPEQLKALSQYRDDLVEISQDVDKDQLSQSLLSTKELFGRSLGLYRSFSAGESPQIQDFCLRKPSGGLSWEARHSLVGLPLHRNYNLKELLTLGHFGLDSLQ